LRRVEISHNNGVDAEVHSGLSEGDAVIIHPPDSVNDGASVVAKQVVIDNATADRLLMDTIEELLFVVEKQNLTPRRKGAKISG